MFSKKYRSVLREELRGEIPTRYRGAQGIGERQKMEQRIVRNMINLTASMLITLMAAGHAISAAAQSDAAAKAFPATPDALMGNYEGRWNAAVDVDPEAAAQIIALGGDEYQIILKAKHDMRCPPKLVTTVKAAKGALEFKQDSWYGVVRDRVFSGGQGSKEKFELKKVELTSPDLGKQPVDLSKSVILFDGKNLDAWQTAKGKPAAWTVLPDGAFMIKPGTGDIETKQKFKDCRLHIEFRLPFMPTARGQSRGNSGVFLQGIYEVQVLDSFGLEGYTDECGGLYKLSAPRVNACRPPLQWQSYDIEYHAPAFDSAGKLTANGRITVYQNGKLIQQDEELLWITAWTETERKGPAPKDAGPIRLQDHGNYIQYRNVWIEPLS